MIIGLGIGIPFNLNQISRLYSPLSLFANGEQGAWYDPSDIKLDWRYNLLTRTEEFGDAVWSKTNVTVTANAVTAPDGTMTSGKLIATAISGEHRLQQGALTTANAQVSFSFYAKAAEYAHVGFYAADGNVGRAFDLTNGTLLGTIGGVAPASSEITNVGGDWYFCVVTWTQTTGNPAPRIYAMNSSTGTMYTGDGTSGIYIWGASLTTAANADKPYQKITDGVSDYFTYQPQPVLFTDAAGTTPVTAVEQPVGLMLDKSKGLVLGPELVVNGGFSTDTTWTKDTGWTIADGKANFKTGGFAAMLTQANVFEVGKCYRVSFDVSSLSSGGVNVYSGATISTPAVNISAQTNGTFTGFILATSTTLGIRGSLAGNYSIDNISVRELPGAHAFQTTATSRPVLSARVNLLTKTESFDDAAWFKGSGTTVSSNASEAPDGTTTADLIQNSTGSAFIQQDASITAGVSYTDRIWVKAATANAVTRFLPASAFGTTSADIDLSSGVVSNVIGSPTVAVVADAGGWWIALTKTASVSVGTGMGQISPKSPGGSIYLWGASLVPANQADLPYQRVNTATDYDAGPAFPRYLRADGVDDFMVTGTITPGTDKAQVFAGVRKIASAGGFIAESSSDLNANNGVLSLVVPNSSPFSNYGFRSKGTLFSSADTVSGLYSAPITNIVTGLGDISGDLVTTRIDGTQAAQSTADQGTGNFLAYPLYLFRRGGTTLPFNGHFYGGIIRFGPNLPIETIQQTEAYMNSKTQAIDWRDITDSSSFRWNSATASPDAE